MRSSLVAAFLVLSSVPAVHAGVVVVDAANGPGTNYTTLLPAISASQDDIVLIRSGTYTGLNQIKKSVALIADAGATVVLKNPLSTSLGSVIQVPGGGFTSPNLHIVMRGLNLETEVPPVPPAAPPHAVIEIGAGFAPQPGSVLFIDEVAINQVLGIGALIGGIERIVVTRSMLLGGDTRIASNGIGTDGGVGLVLEVPAPPFAQDMNLFATTIRGGLGRMATTSILAGPGGIGLVVQSGSVPPPQPLTASGCTIKGGKGGKGAFDPGTGCIVPGQGGTGLEYSGFPYQSYVIGGSLTGGDGGAPASICFNAGPAGAATSTPISPPGFITSIAASPAEPFLARAIREGQTVSIGVTGTPGDAAFLIAGLRQISSFALGITGSLVVDPLWVIPVGNIGSFGLAAISTSAPPDLGSSVDGVLVYMQAFTQEPSGRIVAGAPSVTALLDSQF